MTNKRERREMTFAKVTIALAVGLVVAGSAPAAHAQGSHGGGYVPPPKEPGSIRTGIESHGRVSKGTSSEGGRTVNQAGIEAFCGGIIASGRVRSISGNKNVL